MTHSRTPSPIPTDPLLRAVAAPRWGSLRFVVLLSLWAASFPMCHAVMYTCVIYGNNVPDEVADQIDVDTTTLLQKLKDYAGTDYTAVAPGQSVRTRTRRHLAGATVPGTTKEEEKVEKEEYESTQGDESGHRDLSVIDCPNRCSTSGSTYCRSLGCAYCGTCRRRRRDRDLLENSFSLRRSLSSPASVENAIDRDLADYCQDVTDCELWAKIFVVNGDGSLTPAT